VIISIFMDVTFSILRVAKNARSAKSVRLLRISKVFKGLEKFRAKGHLG
jgi:hypothetical protein